MKADTAHREITSGAFRLSLFIYSGAKINFRKEWDFVEMEFPRAVLSPGETRKYNSKIVQLMSVFLNVAPDFADIESVFEIANASGVSLENAYAELVAAAFGMDTLGSDKDFFRNYFLPAFHEMSTEDFINDPYYKNISIPDAELGKWQFKTMKLKPGEAFVCNDFSVADDGRMIPQIGFFTESFEYPAVLENGREWMTLMPNETVTTKPAVTNAFGKVLTYGMGLGYFAFSASNKECVESVTVVDSSEEVLELFNRHILPQFPNKEKIRTVKADAFAYAEHEMPSENYDYVFADIWHDVSDGRDIYLKMKEYEKSCPDTVFDYWLEGTIKCYLERELWQ